MNDDLNKKIKQITDILGQENMPDNLKGLLSLFANAVGKDETAGKAVETTEKAIETTEKAVDTSVVREEKTGKSEPDDNAEMMRKITKVMGMLNTRGDHRVNLLTAVKPFLSSKRQKKLNNCIQILQLATLTKLMNDNDKSGF